MPFFGWKESQSSAKADNVEKRSRSLFVAFFVVAGEVVDANELEREDETMTLRAAIFLGGKSCFRHANVDDIEKRRSRSLFVACLFVAGEVVNTKVHTKADERERVDGKHVFSFLLVGLGVDNLSCAEKTRNKQTPT